MMIRLLEMVLGLVFVVFIATQILGPAYKNTALFPAFRSKRKKAIQKAVAKAEADDIAKIIPKK